MNCVNCGAFLTDMDLDYCPNCGYNVLIQKKVDYLSKSFYNQGLEKASIRDLSGAIACLKQSLIYDKRNIKARNLLGLVYFETGEVVSALSEWVISKSLQPTRNLATEYINKLQANRNRLNAINETIKKYNHALLLCREGHEDMAAIQLRKILSQNPKLIKGYHLLALIQMKNHEWNKARRTLRKAARIDKTNTTTLRFLREVDEQTGVTTKLEKKGKKGFFHSGSSKQQEMDVLAPDQVVQQPCLQRTLQNFSVFCSDDGNRGWSWCFLRCWQFRQSVREFTRKRTSRSSSTVNRLQVRRAELTKAQNDAKEATNSADEVTQQLTSEQTKSTSYQALLQAYADYQQKNLDDAALELQNVQADVLSDAQKTIYNTISQAVSSGNAGSDDTSGDGSDDSGDYDESDYYE